MKIYRLSIFSLVLTSAIAAEPFNPMGWAGYKTLQVADTAGIARDNDPVDVPFSVPYETTAAAAALRIVLETGAGLAEVPAQFYDVHPDGNSVLSGRAVFLCPMPPNEKKTFRFYYGNPGAGMGSYESTLSVRPAPKGPIDGPRHWMIENDFYRIETYPTSGQIWHIWDKKGTGRIWWLKEWNSLEKGGDPVEWSPNVWVAYPDRVNPDPSSPDSGKKVFAEPLDWNYVIGWPNPKTEVIEGPLFYQLKRSGPVPPHPAHSDPSYDRPTEDIVWAEVTHRFYAGLPWYYQSSTFITLQDMDVYFIRNNQTGFEEDGLFSHLVIRPDTPRLLPGDRDETCILPLMGHFDRMPFAKIKFSGGAFGQGHCLSDILPSKLGYYSLFNPQTGDAYGNFPLLERNSMTTGGEPTMRNHHMTVTDGFDSAISIARTFDYSNQRFNPENVTFLPKGQKFEEENIHLIYRYEGLQSLDVLEHLYETFKHPLVTSWISSP